MLAPVPEVKVPPDPVDAVPRTNCGPRCVKLRSYQFHWPVTESLVRASAMRSSLAAKASRCVSFCSLRMLYCWRRDAVITVGAVAAVTHVYSVRGESSYFSEKR